MRAAAAGHPWLSEAQSYAVLAEVCRVQRGFGRRLFLIAATTETDDHLAGLLEAIAADRHTVVCVQVGT